MSSLAEKENKFSYISELLNKNIKSRADLMVIKRKLAKKYGLSLFSNSEILAEYKNQLENKTGSRRFNLEKILRKRSVRTMSGVAPVAILTKPFPCPGKCAYCPTEKDVPQSYLSNEPAVMRAIRAGFDPYKQVQSRLQALEANGHEPTKIELIVIGGTWSVLPEKYKYWYIKECFRAANDFNKRNSKQTSNSNLKIKLIEEQKKNESAKYKIIGLTLETRPDYINEKELWQMRELGATRVELGVQAIDDKILEKNKRGHGVAAIAEATKRLKDFGFKVTYHLMPCLPGSTAKKDLAMFKKLFTDERFQPDQLKFYPTVVTRGSLLYKWWQAGKYKPYSDKVLQNLIVECKKAVPEYVRIIRLIRDIPGESIMAGNLITNLRQVMKQRGVKCNCIRCREAGEQKFKIKSLKLKIIKYKASSGMEYFIQATDKKKKVLYGFCRLRLGNGAAALIRELHVYGELVPIGNKKIIQHAGLGKMLMKEAEKIARQNDYKKMSIIAGVGVRGYYRKMGYKLENSYMVKDLI